ncbi:MAG: tryptophanase [Thermoplasmata archaeon]|nr:tryptophanase [Thermoplasmata archaeon]
MSSPTAPPEGPMEPYKVKVVERLPLLDRPGREAALERAGYNLFNLTSDEVTIDLLTDSGTSAMSDRQWGGLMVGDESYAGSRNFAHFERVVRDLTGFSHVIPAHQGRAAEHLLLSQLVHPGQIVPNNMHFDTTRAHVVHAGGRPMDLAIREAYDPTSLHPFKGNVDVARLETLLAAEGARRVPLVMVTITNNTGGGQPVSVANLREVAAVSHRHGVPVYLDMCRWAENAYFVREREAEFADRSIREIGRTVFDLVDGATMSAKKDGLVNIGGFVVTRDVELANRIKEQLILFEGFPTYGGLARRDLEAMAIGLEEATDLDYLRHRIGQVRYLASLLSAAGVPLVEPTGGHGVYLDAHRFLPHVPPEQFPGQSIVVELYREGGVRTVEIGEVFRGEKANDDPTAPELSLVRMAIPRRVYSSSHLAHVARTVIAVWNRRATVRGLLMLEAPERLRHFTARFGPAPPAEAVTAPVAKLATGRP